ncbi:hypothetical protein PDJAM_G00193610, partial [Pangasius djambal]|nr:hypothetical protein [Pangasius djambal]
MFTDQNPENLLQNPNRCFKTRHGTSSGLNCRINLVNMDILLGPLCSIQFDSDLSFNTQSF